MSKEQPERVESAHDRYDRKNTRRVSLKFNKNTDTEILVWLDKQKSIQGAIKDAIWKNCRIKAGEKVTLSAYEPGEDDREAIANNY